MRALAEWKAHREGRHVVLLSGGLDCPVTTLARVSEAEPVAGAQGGGEGGDKCVVEGGCLQTGSPSIVPCGGGAGAGEGGVIVG